MRTTATNLGSDPCPYGSGAPSVPNVCEIEPYRPFDVACSWAIRPAIRRARTSRSYGNRGRYASTICNSHGGLARHGSTTRSPTLSAIRMPCSCGAPRSGPGTQVSLWVDESYRYFMIFSGDCLPNFNRRSLAVEPMTCPPNAFRTGALLIRSGTRLLVDGTWGIARGSALAAAGSRFDCCTGCVRFLALSGHAKCHKQTSPSSCVRNQAELEKQ